MCRSLLLQGPCSEVVGVISVVLQCHVEWLILKVCFLDRIGALQ